MRIEIYQNGALIDSKELGEGSYKIGRAPECDLRLRSPGISKQHALLVIKGNKAALLDLGSSNGVFVNGILVRKQRLQTGDEIRIADFEIRIVPPGKPLQTVPNRGFFQGFDSGNAAPALGFSEPGVEEKRPAITAQEKLLEVMDSRVLTPFYSLVETVDWRWILSGILLVSLVLTAILSEIPIVRWGKQVTSREAVARAHTVIAQAVRENARVFAKTGEISAFTVDAAEAEEGMLGVYVVDPRTKQILAPQKYFNKSLTDSDSVFVIDKLMKEIGKVDRAETVRSDGIWILGQPVTITSLETGQPNVVAVLIGQFEVTSDISSTFEPIATACLFAVLLALLAFYFISKMMTYPIIAITEQLDSALKGEDAAIQCKAKFPELEALATQMNFAVSRLKKEGGMAVPISEEDNEAEDGDYVRSVKEFDEGTSDGIILLDRDKRVHFVGKVLGDLVGLRHQYAEGQNISDACKDTGLAGTCIDLADSVVNTLGQTQTATLDINGISRNIAAIGRKNQNGEIRFVLIVIRLGMEES